jgi:acetyl-CoA/propionyl-CoA carboxylase biotin carboxyl carrier protein
VALEWPEDEHVRVDSGIRAGGSVTPHYDPMLAKVIVHAHDRAAALERLRRALRRTTIAGVRSNVEWLGDLLADPAVAADEVTTAWLDTWQWREPEIDDALLWQAAQTLADDPGQVTDAPISPWEALGPLRPGAGSWIVHLQDRDTVHRLALQADPGGAPAAVAVTTDLAAAEQRVLTHPFHGVGRDDVTGALWSDDDPDTIWVTGLGRTRGLRIVPATRHLDLGATGGDTALSSPMPGSVVTVEVAEGDAVTKGQPLLVVEAMKMEHPVTAPVDGVVVDLAVVAGDGVEAGQPLVTVHPTDAEDA